MAGLLATAASARGELLVGVACASDGDTFDVGSTVAYLADIDAPELSQTCEGPRALQSCGRRAADLLAERVEGQAIECSATAIDDYGRSIASCTHRGKDLSGWMVREGYALAFVRYSDRYVGEK